MSCRTWVIGAGIVMFLFGLLMGREKLTMHNPEMSWGIPMIILGGLISIFGIYFLKKPKAKTGWENFKG